MKPEFVAEAREMGIGDLTIGHRRLVDEPLNTEDWAEVERAFLAFQYQLKLIVINARTREV